MELDTMYYPYFRGKLYELVTIRETSELLAEAGFIPIIEPVKESLNGVSRSLHSVCDAGGSALVVVNPRHGDFSNDGESIARFLEDEFADSPNIGSCIRLGSDLSAEQALGLCEVYNRQPMTFLHAGLSEGRSFAEGLGGDLQETTNIFLESDSVIRYRRHFRASQRVLINDGFYLQRGRDYPDLELFSDLHATYEEMGMQGFGDFLTVGDNFSTTGGPAYTVVIHLTFIDPDNDDSMFIYHFKSVRQDTPTDPAGKFAEALDRMITELDRPDSKVFESEAVEEFRTLHAQQHFPGLGYVKKLSMKHHIETLANYFQD